MKNMKRTVSTLLVLAMCLSLLSLGAGAYSQKTQETPIEEVYVYTGSPLVTGENDPYSFETFVPEGAPYEIAHRKLKDSIGNTVEWHHKIRHGETYRLQLILRPLEGYIFKKDTKVFLNDFELMDNGYTTQYVGPDELRPSEYEMVLIGSYPTEKVKIGLTPPVPGEKPDYSPTTDGHCQVYTVNWFEGENLETAVPIRRIDDYHFKTNTSYWAELKLIPYGKDRYTSFTSKTAVYLNSNRMSSSAVRYLGSELTLVQNYKTGLQDTLTLLDAVEITTQKPLTGLEVQPGRTTSTQVSLETVWSPNHSVFRENEIYTGTFTVRAGENVRFTPAAEVYLNGEKLVPERLASGTQLICTKTWPATLLDIPEVQVQVTAPVAGEHANLHIDVPGGGHYYPDYSYGPIAWFEGERFETARPMAEQDVYAARGYYWARVAVSAEEEYSLERMPRMRINGKPATVCSYDSERKVYYGARRFYVEPVGGWQNPFTDVKETDWFYEPVRWAVENGITSGVTAHRFAPNSGCTRSQVVTFLWRAAGEPEPHSTKNPFRDVIPGMWDEKAILWAVEKGITQGVSKDRFAPNKICTRAQIVTFIWRAENKPEPKSTIHPFKDLTETEYYMDAVLWAVENGITQGVSKDRFAPERPCTRGQIVSFLYRNSAI